MAKDKSEANLDTAKDNTLVDNRKAEEINQVDIEKLLRENEGLKQAQSTLTKSNEELRADLNKIRSALGSVVGVQSEEKPTTESLLQTALSKINNLEKEAQKARAKGLLDQAINSFRDEGKELEPKVKDFLRSEVEVEEPDEELIFQKIAQKYQSVRSLMSGSVQRTPDIKSTAGSIHRNPTANEILGI